MIKYITRITFCVCLVVTLHIALTSCNHRKEETATLPAELANKKWIRLYDEQSDGRFWMRPDYHRHLIESFTGRIDTDTNRDDLILAKVNTISSSEWQLAVLEDGGTQDTFLLNIQCIDDARQIYQFKYDNNREENTPFSGYFLGTPPHVVPEFYPDKEHDTKYSRIIHPRFIYNDVSAPTPVNFTYFYNARKTFLEKYGDYTAMEVTSIETFLAKECRSRSKNKVWEIVADRSCDIPFPGFDGKFPHRYVLAKIDIGSDLYEYYLYVFAKLSDKYSCVLVSNFAVYNLVNVRFELTCDDTALSPPAWEKGYTNEAYWENSDKVNLANTKGGFSLFFDTRRSDYMYVVDVSEHTFDTPPQLIPALRWRLMSGAQDDQEIQILSDHEDLILGSGEGCHISLHAFYNEQLRQGLIEEEYDDYTPDE